MVLTTDIGRYVAGTLLCEVLNDLLLRVSRISADYAHGFSVFGLDALVAPYDPAGSLMGVASLDAVVLEAISGSFGVDAVLEEPTPIERNAGFALNAYLHQADASVGQLVNPIDADDTVIVITNPDSFPATGPYPIQIGDEIMTVVGGFGTDTLTVIRGSNASAHGAGSVVVTC